MRGIDVVKLYLNDNSVRLIGGDALGEVIISGEHTEWRKTKDFSCFREVNVADTVYIEVNHQADQYGKFEEIVNTGIFKIEFILDIYEKKKLAFGPKTHGVYFDVFTDSNCCLNETIQTNKVTEHGDLVIFVSSKNKPIPHNIDNLSADERDDYWRKVEKWYRRGTGRDSAVNE